MGEVKKVYLSWDDVNELLDSIHSQVKNRVQYVTGIPRGGTILAILYSHRFDTEYMNYISPHYPDLLVLDDIADSGTTLKEALDKYPEPIYATLHYKEGSIVKPEVFGKHIGKDFGWIVYPWERKDSKTIQNYLDN